LHDVYTLFLCCFRSQMWYIVHPLQKYHTLQEPLIFSTHSEVMLSLCKSLFLQASLLLWLCIKFCCLLDWQMTICMCIMSIAMCPVSHVTIKRITWNKLAFTFASVDNLNPKELG
jgi:hypothetical protein